MAKDDTRSSRTLNAGVFWHVVFPILCLALLLFILWVVYTMPDWALTCSSNLESIRRFASSTSQ
jgi:hypothetical protein